MPKLKASCLCGGVALSVVDHFTYFGLCHCCQCRNMSGSAFSAFAGIPFENLTFEKGEELISYFDKSSGSPVAFCSKCGSSLSGKMSERQLSHLSAGILDDEPTQKPTASYYYGSRSRWHDPDGRIERHDTLPSQSK
jgi:hypothetical protein